MPAPFPDAVHHAIELLSPLGAVKVRRMFGAFGLYVDDLFIAIIASSTLYLKVDDTTRGTFTQAGCVPFEFESKGKTVRLGYMTAPDDAMESPAEMATWARMAMGAALRAR